MGKMVKVETTDESEITEQDALRLTRDLLRIAIHTISHSRGLFPEKYFSVKSAPVIEMKVNVLMPMDAESRRLLDWMDEGVHDALQKKYLKTLLFCICEKKKGLIIEEYTFSFIYHNTNSEEVAMSISCRGLEQNRTVLKSSAAEVTPDQIRSSAREMVQTLIALMRILYPMPEERTILMKLMYNDDYTPEGYEPPFFKHCADNEAIHMWNKSPFKMEMGNFNSKHLVLDLKVKSVLDPSYDNTSIDYVSNQDNECSSTETVVIFVSYLEDSSQHTMKKLIDKMIPEGIVKHSANQRSGHAVTQSESSNKKLLEIAKIVDKMASDANIEHSKLESKYLLRVYRMRESSVMGASSIGADEVLTTQDRQGSRKASVGISCEVGFILCVNPKPTLYNWKLDSGATNHMSGENKWLRNRRNIPGAVPEFLNASNTCINIEEMGDILGPRIRLYDVYRSSILEENELYISVGQLTKNGYVVLIDSGGKLTIHLAENFNHIVGRGALDQNSMSYFLEFFNGSVLERGSLGDETEENNEAKGHWVLDSGSPHHLTGEISMLTKCWDLEQPIKVTIAGEVEDVEVSREGSVSLPNLALNNVYFHPRFRSCVISVPKLNMAAYNFYFAGDKCSIYTEEDLLDGLAYRDQENDVYYVEFLHPPQSVKNCPHKMVTANCENS